MKNYVLLSVICYFSLIISILSYQAPIAMNLSTSQTITNFNIDLGACSCDISTACDVFCCCDPNCSNDQVATWGNSSWCGNSTTQIQKLCTNIGSKGFSTFEDLGCVFFSNRGSIGTFYETPSSTNFVDPNIPKFAVRNQNRQAQYTAPAISSYQQNSPLKVLINGSSSQFPIWIPALGQSCRQSYITITEGVSNYKCVYGITNAQSCEQLNKKLVTSSAIQACATGDCSSTLATPIISSILPSTYDNATGLCSNVINSFQISIKIDYIGSQYKITSMSVNPGPPVNAVGKVYITNNINIQKVGVSLSGKPGYIFGKSLVYSSSGAIYSIADSSQKCVTTANVGTNVLNLKFGVNESFTCLQAFPCSSQLYIDSVVLGTGYKFLKYATKTTEQISVQGLPQKSCKTQSFTLYILYSYSGWVLEPQYYILGSKIVASTNANPSSKMKQLNVKWIKVAPSEISTPPSNNFYAYFQKLWLPLQSAYYSKASFEYSFHYVLVLGLFGFFIF